MRFGKARRIGEVIKFVKLSKSQNCSNLSNSTPLFVKSIMKSPMIMKCSQDSLALLRQSVTSSKSK